MRMNNLGLVGMGFLTTLLYVVTKAPGFQLLFFYYFAVLVFKVTASKTEKS
jgi:hypothetical protein